ncbi:MAG: hypothetical protein ACI861_001881 [Paracoccaceae bacterium]|jgi:hypothetical protein
MNRIIVTLLIVLFAGSTHAQSVNDCDWQASAWNLVEPWEENSRTFSNGKTRLALIDTVEPAAAAFHLLILSPPYGPVGDRQCKTIGLAQGGGFGGIQFQDLQATYDPAIGLMFDLPVRLYDPETSFTNGAILHIVLNQATGEIAADMTLGGE